MKVSDFFKKYHPWIKEYADWLNEYYDATSMGSELVTSGLNKDLPHLVPLHMTFMEFSNGGFNLMDGSAIIKNIPEYDQIIRKQNLDTLIGPPDDQILFL